MTISVTGHDMVALVEYSLVAELRQEQCTFWYGNKEREGLEAPPFPVILRLLKLTSLNLHPVDDALRFLALG